jgi:hypothetical protein
LVRRFPSRRHPTHGLERHEQVGDFDVAVERLELPGDVERRLDESRIIVRVVSASTREAFERIAAVSGWCAFAHFAVA